MKHILGALGAVVMMVVAFLGMALFYIFCAVAPLIICGLAIIWIAKQLGWL